MKKFYLKIAVICFLCGCFIPVASSQHGEHIVGSGHFVKKVEYSSNGLQTGKMVGDKIIPTGYQSNVAGKDDVEKLFFGDFNAPVEFFYDPSFEVPFGFRIVRDSLGRDYILEVKHISNYKEVHSKMDEEFPSKGFPAEQMPSVSKEDREQAALHNVEMYKKRYAESLKLFKVETLSFHVGERFAEALYKKMVSFIDNFKVKGVPDYIMDGYSVTFRNVVDDEVWSLRFHEPRGNALKLSDLCRQIITDAVADKPNESAYISVLEGFDF